ncbi:MAG: ornithine carbamoyltransferase [Thermoprotei archaeon]|nr:MAG: ornithine carbamoyltransferase [Thermoprotei archaeon]
MRHLLTLLDLDRSEIMHLIKLSKVLKWERYEGYLRSNLRGKVVGLLFEKPSTRTRVSIEVAVRELGGSTLYMRGDELQLVRGEPIKDTARVLSRYIHCLFARVKLHETLIEFTKYSSIPIVNALSDLFHPLQALADLMTIEEHFKSFNRVGRVVFVGDGGSNVCHSLMIACVKVGIDYVVACPEEYRPCSFVLELAREEAKETGARIEIVPDPFTAVKDADVIYTDVLVSMGQEHERSTRLRAFLPKYQVNRELLRAIGHNNYVFMHCLPAMRGEEVTDEVIEDNVHSLVFKQAENRLHTTKAVLLWLVGAK